MSNYWQPKIDDWIPESFAGNTEHVKDVYSFVPPSHLTDHVGTQKYAPNEGEEMKVNIAGFGKLSIKEVKDKITEMLKDIINLVDSNKISDIEHLEHKLFRSPELQNIVKEYINKVKELKASSTGLTQG